MLAQATRSWEARRRENLGRPDLTTVTGFVPAFDGPALTNDGVSRSGPSQHGPAATLHRRHQAVLADSDPRRGQRLVWVFRSEHNNMSALL
jgi:hypothetical protein